MRVSGLGFMVYALGVGLGLWLASMVSSASARPPGCSGSMCLVGWSLLDFPKSLV